MNYIILLIIIIVLIAPVYAINECSPSTSVYDIPCQVTSIYPANCTNATVYNYKGVAIKNYSELPLNASGTCYFNWNISVIGSYQIIKSNGDTLNISVVENMLNALVYFGYLIIALVLILFMHLFKEDKGTSMVYGFIASTLSFIMAGMIIGGFDLFPNQIFFIRVNYYIALLTLAIGIYTSTISWGLMKNIKEENKPASGY